MTEQELKDRLRRFAVRIIKMVDSMPHSISSTAIAKQVVRSGTSPIANYRAACLGKSRKDFLNKLKMVEEEIDETGMWLDLIMECEILPRNRVSALYDESQELLKIIISSILTVQNSLNSSNNKDII
ncbi:MAG: four helix bundle protein [Bacteroidaceae bacterium]|nr:four helix bundle protein [Bacteroidaceae bacterium]